MIAQEIWKELLNNKI